jgi:hypothetical protein
MKPCGCSVYTFSMREPWRNALETSNCFKGQLKVTTKAKTILMVDYLITGLKVFV